MPTPNAPDDNPPPEFNLDNNKVKRMSKPQPIPVNTQQPDNRTTPARPRRDSHDVKHHNSERELRKSQADREHPNNPSSNAATSTKQTPSIEHHDARSARSSQAVEADSLNAEIVASYVEVDSVDEAERPTVPPKGPTSTTGPKPIRVSVNANATSQPTSNAHGARSSNDTAPRGGSHTSQPHTGRPLNAQAPPGHLPEEEHQEMSQPTQGSNHSQGMVGSFLSSIMPAAAPPPDMKEELRRAQYHIEAYKQDFLKARRELRNAHHHIEELLNKNQRMKDCIGSLEKDLDNVNHQLEDAKTLSDVRGKELFGSQVFLTKADTLSVSEVGEKVTALNQEIFQAAAALGEALIHRHHELPSRDLDAAAAEAVELVGEKITNVLISQARKPEPEVHPLLVQVVLQVFMVKFCASKIQSWYPSDPTIGGFLDQLYTAIRFREDQAVSGRWRALTRAHTRPVTDTWTNELTHKLMSVLRIASWNTSSPESQDSFVLRLTPIFKAVIELRDAIGEKFTSADLDISVIDCDMVFQPSYMTDTYADGRQKPSGKRAEEIVVGTTGIGLKKLMSGKDAPYFQNVMSAEIVLESGLKEALEPVQPKPRKGLKKKPFENTDVFDQAQEGRESPVCK